MRKLFIAYIPMPFVLALCLLFALCLPTLRAQTAPPPAVLLETIAWTEAEQFLRDTTLVVIPLGAAAKEHGPHLKLSNDLIMAEYLKNRIMAVPGIVIVPTINYHFYPAFLDYPGSTSLRLATARDMIVDVCRSLAQHGPRRFYVLNTGVSTVRALQPAADILAQQGILLRFTNLLEVLQPIEKAIVKQEGGTHADESETSMMLYMDSNSVNMRRAAKDYSPKSTAGPLTRILGAEGTYSPTGIFGDATLATREKGRIITEGLVKAIIGELETLRRENPTAQTAARKLTPDALSVYAGRYETPSLGVVTILHDGTGTLFYKRDEQPQLRLLPESSTRFVTTGGVYKGGDAELSFLRDDKGGVCCLHIRLNNQDILGKKMP